jgi:hypothetical protein
VEREREEIVELLQREANVERAAGTLAAWEALTRAVRLVAARGTKRKGPR